MTTYLIGLSGMWLLTDGIYSIMTYPKENWWRNHSFRLVRMAIGIGLMIIGVPR